MRSRTLLLAIVLAAVAVLSTAPAVDADDGDEGDAEDSEYIAMIGDVGYLSLAEAVRAAAEGDTITMLADDPSTDVIPVGTDTTIEGGGFTFAGRILLLTDVESKYSITISDLVFTAENALSLGVSETEDDGTGEGTEENPDSETDDEPGSAEPVAPGITLSGCSFPSALVLEGCSSVTLSSCGIAGDGAAVISGTGSLTMTGCVLSCGLSVSGFSIVTLSSCEITCEDSVSIAGSGSLRATGCTLCCGISASGFSSVSLSNCTVSSSEPVVVEAADGATVTARGCVFSGCPVTLSGDPGTVSVSDCSFDGSGLSVDVTGSGLSFGITASGETPVSFVDGGIMTAVLSDGTRATATGQSSLIYISGTASLTGDGSELHVRAVGNIAISDYVGTVWFDRSDSQGVTAEESSDEWSIEVSTVGMTIDGATGDGGFTINGSLTVSEDLYVGGTLTVAGSVNVTVAEGAALRGENVVNLGTIDVYGVLSCHIDNTSGTITAHSTAAISGVISGNPVVYPVPAVVTTVLQAVAGEEFVLTLDAEEGTVITGIEGVAWLALDGSVVSGIPDEPGTYHLSVIAESTEYTVTLQYRIEVSEAEDEGASWNVWFVTTVVLVGIMVIAGGYAWTRRSRL